MARSGLVVEVAPGLPLGLDLWAGITAEGSASVRPGPPGCSSFYLSTLNAPEGPSEKPLPTPPAAPPCWLSCVCASLGQEDAIPVMDSTFFLVWGLGV